MKFTSIEAYVCFMFSKELMELMELIKHIFHKFLVSCFLPPMCLNQGLDIGYIAPILECWSFKRDVAHLDDETAKIGSLTAGFIEPWHGGAVQRHDTFDTLNHQ